MPCRLAFRGLLQGAHICYAARRAKARVAAHFWHVLRAAVRAPSVLRQRAAADTRADVASVRGGNIVIQTKKTKNAAAQSCQIRRLYSMLCAQVAKYAQGYDGCY